MTATIWPTLARPLAVGDLFGTPASPLDDEALLARSAAVPRDESAFALLVERYSRLVWAAARAGADGHHADAEDAFQATFLALSRRAGSIRSAATLPAWLHRVAFRAGQAARVASARRALRERLAGAAAPPAAPASDLAATLRAEVERLPTTYRVAVVLCDLDGLSYAEAAARIGCTEAALRNRLARARERLRRRLAGRPRLDLAALLGPARLPSPPARLVSQTLATLRHHAAVTPPVLRLARAATRRAVPVPTTLLAALFGLGGWILGAAQSDGPRAVALPQAPAAPVPAPAPGPAPAPVAAPPPPLRPADEPTPERLHGQVITPDGLPVAGARVVVHLGPDRFEPPTGGTTDAQGRFDFATPEQVRPALQDRPFDLLATAPGWGVGWAEHRAMAGLVNIMLVPEGPPITGRIHDAQGQPIAGVRVAAPSVSCPRSNGNLAAMNAEMEDRLNRPNSTALIFADKRLHDLDLATLTDADGRFTLRGVGANRIAWLDITGPTICEEWRVVLTRSGPIRTYPVIEGSLMAEIVLHPATLDLAVELARVVNLVVRDADSGQPLADWRVHALSQKGDRTNSANYPRTQTDSQGRFQFNGLNRFEAIQVSVSPPPDQPYLSTRLVGTTPGFDPNKPLTIVNRRIMPSVGPRRPTDRPIDLPADPDQPITCEVAVRRTPLLQGRITDRVTGQPLPGQVTWVPLAGESVPPESGPWGINQYSCQTREDGRYALALPPARGLVFVQIHGRAAERYVLGQGIDRLPGWDARKRVVQLGNGWEEPEFAGHVFADLEIKADNPNPTCDLQAEPASPPIALRIVDPAGQPVGGAEVQGLTDLTQSHFRMQPGATTTATLLGLAPGGTRRVVVRHRGRRLGGVKDVAVLDGAEQTIPLAPLGEIRGRIVSQNGTAPPSRVRVWATDEVPPVRPAPGDAYPGPTDYVPVDAEGRFAIDQIIPGVRYTVTARTEDGAHQIPPLGGLLLLPGVVRDLGDLVLQPTPPR